MAVDEEVYRYYQRHAKKVLKDARIDGDLGYDELARKLHASGVYLSPQALTKRSIAERSPSPSHCKCCPI